MWILEHTSVVNAEAEGQFLLLPGKYVIGRLSCDIQCQHASISRKHTELAIGQPEHDSKDSSLSISDKSRYGTILDGDKLGEGHLKCLQPSSEVHRLQFGFKHVYRLTWQGVKLLHLGDVQPALEADCRKLGFALSKIWSADCTHIVAREPVSLSSAPVVWSLLTGRAIVTEGWLFAWKQRQSLKDAQPDPADFKAAVLSSSGVKAPLQRLDALQAAKQEQLLAGLQFHVAEDVEDREALRGIIELCGGTLALSSRQAAINIAPEKSEAFAADDSMAASPNILLDCLQSGSKDKLLKRKPSSQIEKTNGPVELLSTVEADDIDGLEDTDAEEEYEVEPLASGSPAKPSLPEKASSTHQKSTEEGSANITFAALVLKKPKPPILRGKAVSTTEKNFKAFKRKQNSTQAVPRILGVSKMNESVPAIDASAFLNAEKLQRERAKAADELFATKLAPKKVTTAKRGRIL